MRRIKRPKRIVKSTCSVQTSEGNIPFVLSRSTGRRTLTITIDEKADVGIASPFNMKEKEIHDFVHEKARWILEKVKEARKTKNILDQKEFVHGARFLFLGKKYKLSVQRGNVKRSRIVFDNLSGWSVTVPQNCINEHLKNEIKGKMLKWYRSQATEVLGGRIFHYSRIMGVQPKKIGIRSQKRLWGCCDYNTQTIHLNWQIILSPIKVVDYIVIHELCHLTHPNHGKRFWRRLEKFMPDFKEYKGWLSANHLDMILP